MGKLILFGLVGVYIWGAWKFWSGYHRTNFQPSLLTRVALALLWPGLVVVNPAFRRNFQKALKGR